MTQINQQLEILKFLQIQNIFYNSINKASKRTDFMKSLQQKA